MHIIDWILEKQSRLHKVRTVSLELSGMRTNLLNIVSLAIGHGSTLGPEIM